MQTAFILIVTLVNAFVVGVGMYLSSYIKKKAENLATREEFKELEKQTAELTRTTAQIEAEISDIQWDRQKRWELKREVLFELAKRVAAALVTLKNLQTILRFCDSNWRVLPRFLRCGNKIGLMGMTNGSRQSKLLMSRDCLLE